ncbi:GSCOCG00003128001-RA-CDS [Cotesia congregata]|nr:GSCOCG00003128001-RA-CDS [Cotesia congregata]
MRGIMKTSLGVLIVVLIINSGGQVLAKKSNKDKFDLSAIESRKIAVKSDQLWNQGIIPYIVKKALAWKPSWFVSRAIKFWESKTCVKFINYDQDQHPNYMLFTKTDNHNSRLGKFQNGKKYCKYQ